MLSGIAATSLRSYYARLIAVKAGIDDAKLIEALTIVERERFLGPGPWKVNFLACGYVDTPGDTWPRWPSKPRFLAVGCRSRLNLLPQKLFLVATSSM